MIKPIDLDEIIPYVCDCDKDEENPVIWKFRHPTYKQEIYFKKKRMRLPDDITIMPDISAEALHICLVGADNWPAEMQKVEVKKEEELKQVCSEKWSDKTLASIPVNIRDELAAHSIKIFENNLELSEEEAKN
jgi:hypothetical protein